jgi:hypothetical protein
LPTATERRLAPDGRITPPHSDKDFFLLRSFTPFFFFPHTTAKVPIKAELKCHLHLQSSGSMEFADTKESHIPVLTFSVCHLHPLSRQLIIMLFPLTPSSH